MAIKKQVAYRRVLLAWLNTIVALTVMLLMLTGMIVIGVRFIPIRGIMAILIPLVLMSMTIFVFSPVVVNLLMQAQPAERSSHPNFVNAVDDLCRKLGMRVQPRLYILKTPMPNACAYGHGFFGLANIGVSQDLYDMLTQAELKAVLAHELAHIRQRDTGLMSMIAVLRGGSDQIARIFLNAKTAPVRGPVALVLGAVFWLLSKVFFPIGASAISQERETAADALATLYVGSPDALISALEKLHAAFERMTGEHPRPKTLIDDLFISHPKMDNRLDQLRSYARHS